MNFWEMFFGETEEEYQARVQHERDIQEALMQTFEAMSEQRGDFALWEVEEPTGQKPERNFPGYL